MTAFKSPAIAVSPIATDVAQGLSVHPRRLPPKLFYDAAGSDLFEQITETPEYYLTRTERSILKERAGDIERVKSGILYAVGMGHLTLADK